MKKKPASLASRIAAANARKVAALASFEAVAADLKAAHDEHVDLAVEAREEIERLVVAEAEALAAADHAARVAEKVADLLA